MVCKVSRNVNVEVIIESLKNSSYIRYIIISISIIIIIIPELYLGFYLIDLVAIYMYPPGTYVGTIFHVSLTSPYI